MLVLVVNAGSSSVRLGLLDDRDRVVAHEHVERSVDEAQGTIAAFVAALDERPDAVGHRVVHGGDTFRAPVLVDDAVEHAIESLTSLAPLHQPAALAALRIVRDALPGTPAVACFDTAFHATLPPAAATYALPSAWRSHWGLRRFGFHGLSHAHAARTVGRRLGDAPGARIVSCHLGAGASLCATRGGVSVDTTMGFTPLEGLVMATRSGAVDPGLLLWLLDGRVDAAELAHGLLHDSGLAGLAGSADMRDVLARRAVGDERAALGFDVYVHRLAALVAAMTASLGGLDALVFTGGVGEHEPEVRASVARRLGYLGVDIDRDENRAAVGVDADITGAGAAAATFVVVAREDAEIARAVRELLGRQ